LQSAWSNDTLFLVESSPAWYFIEGLRPLEISYFGRLPGTSHLPKGEPADRSANSSSAASRLLSCRSSKKLAAWIQVPGCGHEPERNLSGERKRSAGARVPDRSPNESIGSPAGDIESPISRPGLAQAVFGEEDLGEAPVKKKALGHAKRTGEEMRDRRDTTKAGRRFLRNLFD
jgi:hypothetical protein